MELSNDFILELIKLCLTDTKTLNICRMHLKYHFLFNEEQKKIVKFIFDSYDVSSKPPTIGMIGQAFSTDQEIITLLSRIRKIIIEKEQYDEIIATLETFIKDSRFRVLYDKLGDLYNEGKKKEAILLLEREAREIHDFHLKDSYYTRVFQDFEKRQEERDNNKDTLLLDKCTFGIHELDDYTRGGQNKGTSVLVIARSGVGKSTFLRWMGLCNARLGRRVVHFQAEGSERECLDAYDSGWTSISLHDMELGQIPDSKKSDILKAQQHIVSNGGEVYVYAAETFDSMSIDKCRDILVDIEQIYGKVDLVLFDYLELFTVKGQFGSSEASERKRREEVSNKITNIAVEFKCTTVTATQAVDLPPATYNNEEFVMTRTHASEFKNIVKPFSTVMSLNQTDGEYDSEIVRIWVDKFRKYKRPTKPIRIYQSRGNGRFYDALRTINNFYKQI